MVKAAPRFWLVGLLAALATSPLSAQNAPVSPGVDETTNFQATLDQLQQKSTVWQQLQERTEELHVPAEDTSPADTLPAAEKPWPELLRSHSLELLAALAAIATLLFGLALGRVRRSRQRPPTGPLASLGQGEELTVLVGSDDDWRQRALAAEQRADKAQAVIREGLLGHLARWMSDALVQKLLLQRAHLIESQEKAVTEVDRLGQRLETIQFRMQDRLLAYEREISRLEKELDTKDIINRELIQAEIQAIKRQMDVERVKSESGFN